MVTPESTGHGHVTAPLLALSDDELETFVRKLDAALREARLGPEDLELAEAHTIAASARILLRYRRARAAGDRAKNLVRQLISTETIE